MVTDHGGCVGPDPTKETHELSAHAPGRGGGRCPGDRRRPGPPDPERVRGARPGGLPRRPRRAAGGPDDARREDRDGPRRRLPRRQRLRRHRAGQRPPRDPRAAPGRLPGRRRQRLDRGHPVGRHQRAGLDLGPRPRAGVRPGVRRGAGRQGAQRRPRADHQHPPAAGLGTGARDVQRGPLPHGAAVRAGHQGDPGQPRRGDREALRGQQPGGPAQLDRRERVGARAARDLPAGVQGGRAAGPGRRDHVLLQPGQRHVRLRERRGAAATRCGRPGSSTAW